MNSPTEGLPSDPEREPWVCSPEEKNQLIVCTVISRALGKVVRYVEISIGNVYILAEELRGPEEVVNVDPSTYTPYSRLVHPVTWFDRNLRRLSFSSLLGQGKRSVIGDLFTSIGTPGSQDRIPFYGASIHSMYTIYCHASTPL